MSTSYPTINGELHRQLERARVAWAQCVAETGAVIACHEEGN
ncbi:Rz1-like lysis system protein LysC [Kushneria marisflavi]